MFDNIVFVFSCVSFLLTTINAGLPPLNSSELSVSHTSDGNSFKTVNVHNESEIVDESDNSDGQSPGINVIRKLVRKAFEERENDDNDVTHNNNGTDYEASEEGEEEAKEVMSSIAPHANDTIKLLMKWSSQLESLVTSIYKEVLPFFLKLQEDVQLSGECASTLLVIAAGLLKQEPWAFRFLDANGRIPPGFFDGTLTDFGEYDQCLEIEIPKNDEDLHDTVVGKYCLLRADFPMPKTDLLKVRFHDITIDLKGTPLENSTWSSLTKFFNALYTVKGFRFGLCMPSTCEAQEIENLINKALGSVLGLPFTVGPEIECDTKNDKIEITIYQKIAIAVYGLTIFLVLLGTFIEIYVNFQKENTNDEKESKSRVTEVLLCFSVLRNTRELFQVKEKRSNLSVVHGIRVLSMMWIIVGHTYLFGTVYRMLYTFKRLQVDIPKYPGRIQYQALNNSYLCVDSFFFISGLVLVYVSLPLLKKTKGKFNYLLYIAHRWLRMTPALIGLILFIYLFPFFGSGPVFKHHVNPYVNSCERNWWYDLLYISNWYQDIPGMCAEQVWFIGADFQLYIFAPLIFLLYNRSEKKGLIVNIVVLIIGIVSSGIAVYVTDSQATFTLDHVINEEYLHFQLLTSYLPTYQHIAPYCIGMLCGYLILKYTKDDKKPNIPIAAQILMWIILPSASLYAMFSTYRWNNYLESSQPSLFTTITFAALQRSLWCIGIAWITFTCAVGKGSIVNDFLSAKVFVPFSRLSFCVFLMHLSPILLRAFSVKFTRNWDDHTFLSWAAMNVILSTLAAFALYTLFEAPFQRLEKMVFRSNDCQRKQHSANNELRTANVDCSERSTQKSSTSMRL